ncbi:hypothetical protein [Saccharospirillum alexandrii]|uniref:hypothetical protein n=1 Tax=Saccharospirillum alexandrii TaxID=2448477 RepID=UPI0013E0DEF9|nr:hypothetical protein [Saccharospirillum alexandrii]
MGILWVSVVIQAGRVGTRMARQYGTVSTGVELGSWQMVTFGASDCREFESHWRNNP